MTINFSVGDWVRPNSVFLETLQATASAQTIATLGILLGQPSEVMATGNLTYPAYSYIRVRPKKVQHIAYKKGQGVVLFFTSDTLLNNSFEASEAFLKDQQIVRCYNNSGGVISKNEVVRQTGFDNTEQLPTIAKANASTAANAVVLGVAQEDISDTTAGSILVDGSFQFNTSGYSLGDIAYLSDTPGAISSSAGTVSTSVGRVLSVGMSGTISLFSVLTGSVGGASGGGGGGGDTPTPAITVTGPRTIANADNGKTLWVPSTSPDLELTIDSGLADGFEFKTLIDSGRVVTVIPPGTQRIGATNRSPAYGDLGASLRTTSSGIKSGEWKLIGTSWIVDAFAGWEWEPVLYSLYSTYWTPGGVGIDAYATTETAQGISDNPDSIAFSGWIKPNGIDTGVIFHVGDPSNNGLTSFSIRLGTVSEGAHSLIVDVTEDGVIGGSNAKQYVVDNALSVDSWSQFGFGFATEGATGTTGGELRIFVNEVEHVATPIVDNAVDSIYGLAGSPTSMYVTVGAKRTSGSFGSFFGPQKTDDFMIISDVYADQLLSFMNQAYNGGIPQDMQGVGWGLIASWLMGDGATVYPSIVDSVGDTLNLTIIDGSGSAMFNSDVPGS